MTAFNSNIETKDVTSRFGWRMRTSFLYSAENPLLAL